MGKIIRGSAVLFLVGFFCLVLSGPAFSQEVVAGQVMTAEQLTADIGQKWSTIQDFQADLTVGMQVFGKMTKMKGTIWQKDKLFRGEMTLPPELMPQTDKLAEPPKVLVVFDGKVMWQTLPMMSIVTKTDFSALDGTIKSLPFSKSLYSLPAVSYRLSEKKRNGEDYYFLETKDSKEFIQNSPVAALGVNLPANMSFHSIGLWVNKNTLFPDLIEFYVQKNTPGMSLEFKNIKIDQGLSPMLFVFKVPDGAQVMDMTASIKAIAKKTAAKQQPKQSTVTDTTQVTKVVPETPAGQSTVPDTVQTPQ
jgi:outer membrane lipoprotein-sorting protein